jgi:hypothetical protein
MIKKKRGVVVKGLKQTMNKPIELAKNLYLLAGVDFVITDGVANRPNKSLHPLGHAIDLRIRDLTHTQKGVIFTILTQELGRDYDVLLKSDHLHIEYNRILEDSKDLDIMRSFLVDDFEEVS